MSFEPVYISRRTALRAGAGAATAVGLGAGQLSGAGGASAAPAAGASATGASDTGYILSCDEWGARPPSEPPSLTTGLTRRIVVHHTAFDNTDDHSLEAAVACAEKIQYIHMDLNKWIDTGNHFTISRGGYVLEGRHRSLEALDDGGFQVVSAHAVGQNTQSIGIENEGTYITELPTGKLWVSLVRLCTTICTQYGFGAERITGHWDWNNTQCPGARFYSAFPLLRLLVARALDQDPADIPARTWPDTFTSCAGATVTTLQHLLRAAGYADVAATGAYTPQTLAAVHAVQTANGFPTTSDGTVSAETWEALAPKLGKGDTGEAVLALQTMLATKLFEVTATGTYDRATTVAVAKMQALHGLKPTGRTDHATWCATLGGVVREEFRLLGRRGAIPEGSARPDAAKLPPVAVPERGLASAQDPASSMFERNPVVQDVR